MCVSGCAIIISGVCLCDVYRGMYARVLGVCLCVYRRVHFIFNWTVLS